MEEQDVAFLKDTSMQIWLQFFFSFNLEKNWVFSTNPKFLIPIYLQPDGVNLW